MVNSTNTIAEKVANANHEPIWDIIKMIVAAYPTVCILLITCIIIFLMCIIFKIVNTIAHHGFSFRTLTGEFGIFTTKKNESNNTKPKTTACDICKQNVAQLVKDMSYICSEMYYIQYAECIQRQFNEVENRIYMAASFITNCHAQLVSKHVKSLNIQDTDIKTNMLLKNNKILSYIWQAKKEAVGEFFKKSIIHNNFHDKNSAELRIFVDEKCKILMAKLQDGVNLFPDWDDPDLFVTQELYEKELYDTIMEWCRRNAYELYERCQNIHEEYQVQIKQKQAEIDTLADKFAHNIPSF